MSVAESCEISNPTEMLHVQQSFSGSVILLMISVIVNSQLWFLAINFLLIFYWTEGLVFACVWYFIKYGTLNQCVVFAW